MFQKSLDENIVKQRKEDTSNLTTRDIFYTESCETIFFNGLKRAFQNCFFSWKIVMAEKSILRNFVYKMALLFVGSKYRRKSIFHNSR